MTIARSSITLHDLRFYAYHGVLPQERRVGGEYTVTLRVDADLSRAVVSDDVNDTLNYADLYAVVKDEMSKPSALLEHVAGRIGHAVCRQFPMVESLTVTITKVNPPMGADCGGASVELFIKNER